MTAKQIMDFAEQNSNAKDMFNELEEELNEEKTATLIKLESDYKNKKLTRRYNDICEKLRMVMIMRTQRLELFLQAQKR